MGEVMLIKAEAEFKTKKEEELKKTLLGLAKNKIQHYWIFYFWRKNKKLSGEQYYTELLNERARETSFWSGFVGLI